MTFAFNTNMTTTFDFNDPLLQFLQVDIDPLDKSFELRFVNFSNPIQDGTLG